MSPDTRLSDEFNLMAILRLICRHVRIIPQFITDCTTLLGKQLALEAGDPSSIKLTEKAILSNYLYLTILCLPAGMMAAVPLTIGSQKEMIDVRQVIKSRY